MKTNITRRRYPTRTVGKKRMIYNAPKNTLAIECDKGLFEKVARKRNVDYAFHQNRQGQISAFTQERTGRRDNRGIFGIFCACGKTIISWTEPDDETNLSAKKIIVTNLINRIESGTNYQIYIDFHIDLAPYSIQLDLYAHSEGETA